MNEVTRNLVKTSEHLRDKTYLCGEERSVWDAGRETVGGSADDLDEEKSGLILRISAKCPPRRKLQRAELLCPLMRKTEEQMVIALRNKRNGAQIATMLSSFFFAACFLNAT